MAENIRTEKLNKVLFIDDDDTTIEYYKILSRDFNLAKKTKFYTNTDVALGYLTEIIHPEDFPELIFVDINMPKMDGHEFAAKVMQMHAFKPELTYIVFLTTSKEIKDLVKAEENEVEFYCVKPLTEITLKRLLRDCFNITA